MANKSAKKKLKPSERGMQKVTMRIPKGEWKTLKKTLQTEGKTITGYFRKIIKDFLESEIVSK